MKNIINTALVILKLVIPFYLLADILIYFHILEHISFLFEPFTYILGFDEKLALSLAAGMLFNIYAGIAFAAPLNLTPYEWTMLGLFMGIAHALPVENAIMKKLGISVWYSTILRITGGILAVYIFKLFNFNLNGETVLKSMEINHYNSFFDMLSHSVYNASVLALKIIILISVIIVFMDFIKTKFFKNKNISAHFSILTGLILGITYGAGILIKEKEKLSRKEIIFIGTFLMICHSVIEDTALFAIFGASIWILISIRLILAIIISYLVVRLYK
ncbi:conserved hypothetical protein [Lebetimonas natsushimae]|uniref:Nucleoside transporter/FeoB GTPase Gate domain-containing protein n=1 Tax=Lebetimonas natsushimae TaxID=1936991 RepID=A0A292YHC5_9BACT|nr:nucleoside recognition protein [Lebetimonas natsushimae]GAX88366.1 conserved hypothetical protein [Lebetimonas natsushimae]